MAVTTQVSTGEIPGVLEPYFTGRGTPGSTDYIQGLLPQAQSVFAQPYEQRYGALAQAGLEGAGRVAGISPFQQEVGTQLAAMGAPQQFGLATGYGQAAGNVFQDLTGTQAQQVGIGSITSPGALGAYMSPYMQAVVDQQKAAAQLDAQKAQLAGNLASARTGTYGGARNLLATTEREKALASQMGNIQAQGLQNAYQQALGQFNVENQLGLTAQQANQQAALQAAAQRQQAGVGLSGLGTTMSNVGIAQQAADLDRLKTMGAYGDLERGIQQQQIDAQREDMLRRLNYPQESIGQMANLLRGVPVTDQTTATATPAPSFASQLAGVGLTGLSLYNMLGKS